MRKSLCDTRGAIKTNFCLSRSARPSVREPVLRCVPGTVILRVYRWPAPRRYSVEFHIAFVSSQPRFVVICRASPSVLHSVKHQCGWVSAAVTQQHFTHQGGSARYGRFPCFGINSIIAQVRLKIGHRSLSLICLCASRRGPFLIFDEKPTFDAATPFLN